MAFVGFHAHVQNVFLKLINISYEIVLHHLNHDMPMLKTVTTLKKTLQLFNRHEIIIQQDPHVELYNIHSLIISVMSTNKLKLDEVNGGGAISANDEATNIFTLLTLHLPHTHYKKTWNQMVIKNHLVTLFTIQYLHLLYSINHVCMLLHVEIKNMLQCQKI